LPTWLLKPACVGRAESYQYTWYSYDNQSDKMKRLDRAYSAALESIPIPPKVRPGFLAVECRTIRRAKVDWEKPVVVYLKLERTVYRVIGIEREEENGWQDLERRRQLAQGRGEQASAE